MFKELDFPSGIRLLQSWQAGDAAAVARMQHIFNQTISGHCDDLFHVPAPTDRVHVCGPVDLLTLTLMYRLYGITAESFYKQDAARFVRTSLMTQKLLGLPRHYLSWPVYGLTAETLGQEMIYADQFSPGTDPDKPLLNREHWQSIKPPDLHHGIPKQLDEIVDCYHQLTGLQPLLHLSAPYSLAADIFGQEAIITALTHEPDFVNQLLDQLMDTVLQPWIGHFFHRYPAGWVELSDASGSPFFIGPHNCKHVAIRAIQRLKNAHPWGDRVYVANYRGDYVTQASMSRDNNRRRRGQKNPPAGISLRELLQAKYSVCQDFVIRLAEDRMPISRYEEQAVEKCIPLLLGIGATQIDRNSIGDLSTTRHETAASSKAYVEAIKRVASKIARAGYAVKQPPWPGAIYFEDISAESSFELIETIVATTLGYGGLTGK
ncbi:MAG: hypothetical protein GY770_21965 [Aestuariibacter sp.]|nr:hypothetical protein [Aestuariibacter sp.]